MLGARFLQAVAPLSPWIQMPLCSASVGVSAEQVRSPLGPATALSLELVASRLSTVAPNLAEQLESQPTQALRKVAAETTGLVAARIQLADPRFDSAVAAIREGGLGDSTGLSGMRRLTEELDQIAWDVQESVEQGLLPRKACREAFTRARAAAAVGFALEPDALYAALESVYEAWAALVDIDAVRTVVMIALDRGGQGSRFR
jgi:hypothetical protein